jgi:hypothetical protein
VDLQVGDQIHRLESEYGTVERVTVITQTETMYNLTVDKTHTFFVGDGAWLVHNTNKFCRFGSQVEANNAQASNRLEMPQSGMGSRTEKWISRFDAVDPKASFGDPRNYTHRMDIETSGRAVEWLDRNAIDYDAYRDAIANNMDIVQGTSTLRQNVLVLTKPNELGWYGLTEAGLGLFNRNINKINVTRIR